jgi:hypothetical protein
MRTPPVAVVSGGWAAGLGVLRRGRVALDLGGLVGFGQPPKRSAARRSLDYALRLDGLDLLDRW